MRKRICFILLVLCINLQIFAQYSWSNVGTGANLGVQALCADTNTNTLYLGGIFTTAGIVPAIGIAQWDGANYSAVGSGLLTGVGVSSLALDTGGNLVAGGTFVNIGGLLTKNIARWDGISWSALGAGLDVTVGVAIVKSLAVYNNEIYAGGTFTQSGVSPLSNIARWDGSAWQPLTTGTNGVVNALCVYNNELYVGGTFTDAGGVQVNNIAKWDGTNWSDVGGGVNYTGAISVSALEVYNGDLYAGGTFTTAGTTPVNHIARWDGLNWSDPGGGANYTGAISISAFEVFNGELVAGGKFDSLGTTTCNYVGKWNGTVWSPMGTGMNNEVQTLSALRDTLYAGGSFTTADGNLTLFIAQWIPSLIGVSTHFSQKTDLSVYPNPAKNKIWIKGDVVNDGVQFCLYDLTGREVLKKDRIKGEVDLGDDLLPGIYFYKIRKGKAVLDQGRLILIR